MKVGDEEWAALFEAEVREKARRLNIPAVKLMESVLKAWKLVGSEPFAVLAIPRGEGVVDIGLAPAISGKVTVPKGAEFIIAIMPNKAGGVPFSQITVLHDDGCPAIREDLMQNCNCEPEYRIDPVREA